jgi:hypothetical protein
VGKYFSKLSFSELQQMQNQFWESAYGQGLKLWKNQLDFSNRLVTASFKRYVYQKYILKA